MTRSTWLHLRFSFSFYLFPVFSFALSQTRSIDLGRAVAVFIVLHLLAYPASNGFNSYYDRDVGSIGGLEHPLTVTADLLYVSLVLDALALGLGLFLGWRFAALLFIAGLASKAYSHPAIRLKARPWLGWLTVVVFQGAFTYVLIVVGIVGLTYTEAASKEIIRPALLSSLLFGGAYPMTQIYQHAEDARRQDRTLSRVLGIRGTFVFSGVFLAVSMVAFFLHFEALGRYGDFYLMLVFVSPIAGYSIIWFVRVLRDGTQANFQSARWLSRISATALICCFSVLAIRAPAFRLCQETSRLKRAPTNSGPTNSGPTKALPFHRRS